MPRCNSIWNNEDVVGLSNERKPIHQNPKDKDLNNYRSLYGLQQRANRYGSYKETEPKIT